MSSIIINTIFYNNKKYFTETTPVENEHIYKIGYDYDSGIIKLWYYVKKYNIWKHCADFTGEILITSIDEKLTLKFNNGIKIS